jgi:hypothetical protein
MLDARQKIFPKNVLEMILPDNIRELAIQFEYDKNIFELNITQHLFCFDIVMAAAKRWKQLKVLIFHHIPFNMKFDRLDESIILLISELTNLNYFCLVGDYGTQLIEQTKRAVREKIGPVRPLFRFYIGPYLYHMYYPYE